MDTSTAAIDKGPLSEERLSNERLSNERLSNERLSNDNNIAASNLPAADGTHAPRRPTACANGAMLNITSRRETAANLRAWSADGLYEAQVPDAFNCSLPKLLADPIAHVVEFREFLAFAVAEEWQLTGRLHHARRAESAQPHGAPTLRREVCE